MRGFAETLRVERYLYIFSAILCALCTVASKWAAPDTIFQSTQNEVPVHHEVWIPPVHRDLTGGVERVQVEAATVGEVVAALDARYPGMAARLTQDGRLRPGIAVAVDGVIATRGLRQRLPTPGEIHFIPALAGG